MVAYARLERGLSDPEAMAESAAELRHAIAELELLSLGDDAPPFPGGLPLADSAMQDGTVMNMTPAEVRASRRLWEYIAAVAVDEGHPRLRGAELTEIAESLAGLVLGYLTRLIAAWQASDARGTTA